MVPLKMTVTRALPTYTHFQGRSFYKVEIRGIGGNFPDISQLVGPKPHVAKLRAGSGTAFVGSGGGSGGPGGGFF